MKLSDLLIPELDQEMVTARNTLERIPEDKLSWKPHPKSMPLDRLAGTWPSWRDGPFQPSSRIFSTSCLLANHRFNPQSQRHGSRCWKYSTRTAKRVAGPSRELAMNI